MEEHISRIIDTEKAYQALFSQVDVLTNGLRYTDRLLPGMYCHNNYRHEPDGGMIPFSLYASEKQYRVSEGQDTVQVEFFDASDAAFPEGLGADDVSEQHVMYAPLEELTAVNTVDARLVKADTEELFAVGTHIDQIGFGEEFADFAVKRYTRKAFVYADENIPFYNLICYIDDTAVGNVDLFINDDIAKIEDLDVLPEYRNNGYGTAMLALIRDICREQKVCDTYLLVDEENEGAQRLYGRLGFREVMRNHMYRKQIDTP